MPGVGIPTSLLGTLAYWRSYVVAADIRAAEAAAAAQVDAARQTAATNADNL